MSLQIRFGGKNILKRSYSGLNTVENVSLLQTLKKNTECC